MMACAKSGRHTLPSHPLTKNYRPEGLHEWFRTRTFSSNDSQQPIPYCEIAEIDPSQFQHHQVNTLQYGGSLQLLACGSFFNFISLSTLPHLNIKVEMHSSTSHAKVTHLPLFINYFMKLIIMFEATIKQAEIG